MLPWNSEVFGVFKTFFILREREKSCISLVHSPVNCGASMGQARPQAGASSGSPTWLAETQTLGPSSAFSRASGGSWIASGAAGTHIEPALQDRLLA